MGPQIGRYYEIKLWNSFHSTMPSCPHTVAATSVTLLEGTAGQAIDMDTNGTIDWSKFCIIWSALNEYPTIKKLLITAFTRNHPI